MACDAIDGLPFCEMAVETDLHPDLHERSLRGSLGQSDHSVTALTRELRDADVALVCEVDVGRKVEQLVEAQ